MASLKNVERQTFRKTIGPRKANNELKLKKKGGTISENVYCIGCNKQQKRRQVSIDLFQKGTRTG